MASFEQRSPVAVIVTFTPNPSIDTTLEVEFLERGGVLRSRSVSREAGGKGFNVAHAAMKAGRETLAIAPCGGSDPFALLARATGIPFKSIAIEGRIRTNMTLTEADGTTTKINEPGPHLTEEDTVRLANALINTVAETRAEAVILAGSLPQGAPANWYASLCGSVRKACPSAFLAVDTSESPLLELGAHLRSHSDDVAPDLLKPNAMELAQLTCANGPELESDSARGHYEKVVTAARELIALGVREVLVTLGASGACLVTEAGAWASTPPPATIKSTVGAGDSSLAGYVMKRVSGGSPADCLRNAVAYGTASASRPGSGIASPEDLDMERTHVVELDLP